MPKVAGHQSNLFLPAFNNTWGEFVHERNQARQNGGIPLLHLEQSNVREIVFAGGQFNAIEEKQARPA